MILLALAAMMAAADSTAAEEPHPPVGEVRFAPLERSEHQYANIGPVGPYYPAVAVTAQKSGEATIECRTSSSGALKRCRTISEEPRGYHFGDAAVVMAGRKRISPADQPPPNTVIRLRVPFELGAPAEVVR